jgi:nitroreductase
MQLLTRSKLIKPPICSLYLRSSLGIMTISSNFDSHYASGTHNHHQCVTKILSSRHSTRAFLKTPVPRAVLEKVLADAQHAPSNSNLQPWRLKVVTGNALQRLTSSLVSTVSSGTPSAVESYRHYRSALGKQLYGPEGYDIPRADEKRMREAQLRNYKFFDAPCAFIVCMDQSLAQVDVLSTGMYLQALCLLLAEYGIATCVQVSVAGYPQVRDPFSLSTCLLSVVSTPTPKTCPNMIRSSRKSLSWQMRC